MPDDTVTENLPDRIATLEQGLAEVKALVENMGATVDQKLAGFFTNLEKATQDIVGGTVSKVEEHIGDKLKELPTGFEERLTDLEAVAEHVVTNLKTTLGSTFEYIAPANRPLIEASTEAQEKVA